MTNLSATLFVTNVMWH